MGNQKYKSLDEILRTYLKQKKEKRDKEVDLDWWWASELGQCQRRAFLRRLGIQPNQKPWRISFLGEQGKAIHGWVEDSVGEMGCLVAKEFPLKDKKLHYKGRGDLIVNFGEFDKPYLSLIDVKTQRPEAFFRRSKLPVGQRVKPFQKIQLCSYFYFALKKWSELIKSKKIDKAFKPTDLKEARIYYIDRGGGGREEFIFHFKKKDFTEVLTELNTLNDYWKKQELPPCKKGWMCNDLCKPYRKELKEVENGKVSLKEFIKKNAIRSL